MTTTTLNPMTAPLTDVLDWLAVMDGWTHDETIVRQDGSRTTWWIREARRGEPEYPAFVRTVNPITLGRLAGMLDDRVGFSMFKRPGADSRPVQWMAHAWDDGVFTIHNHHPSNPRCATAIEAAARVVAAVLMKQEPPRLT